MLQNRRHFLKSGFIALGAIPLVPLFFKTARAEALDGQVTKQGYTTTLPPAKEADKKKYDKHLAKVSKIKPDAVPNCKNCKHFKPVPAHSGWGKCAMVGATGKPGKLVAQDGWCKVWFINKKAF